MANNQKKIDPTEAALSAIQEALEVREPETPAKESPAPVSATAPEVVTEVRKPARKAVNTDDEELFGEQPALRASSRSDDGPALRRPAANDDRHSIGQILQAVQRRPSRMSYTLATLLSIAWIAGGIGLASIYMDRLEAILAQTQGQGSAPLLVGLGALFVLPVFFFFALAHMVSRSRELRAIAQSMAEVAIRLAEPETVARESIVSVGHAIRREVAAMGDGVERALARAAELEALVHNEVSALERAYNDNEVRIRGMLQDLASQRDMLVSQAEQVRSAISGVHLNLSHDISAVSDLVAERVSETAQRITHTIADKGEHITVALGRAGDSMINALTERGGDLLERLERTSSQTAHAIATASDRMMAGLNFRTDSIHEEFNGLATGLLHSVNTQLIEAAENFEQRSNTFVDVMANRTREMAASIIDNSTHIADTLTTRVEEVNSTLKATGESLVLDLSLRGSDVVANIDQAGKNIADTLSSHGGTIVSRLEQTGASVTGALMSRSDHITEVFQTSGDELARTVDAKGEAVKNMLAARLLAFEEMFSHGGVELGEKISRESNVLGNLITRNLSEFDRTVKTYGGELVERLGKRTEEVADAIRTYVDSFDVRVTSRADEITSALDHRLVAFEEALDGRSKSLEESLASRSRSLEETLTGSSRALDESLESRISGIAHAIDSRVAGITNVIDSRISEITDVIGIRGDNVAATLVAKIEHIDRTLAARALEIAGNLDSRIQRIESVEETLAGSSRALDESLDSRISGITHAIDSRVAGITNVIDSRISHITEVIGIRGDSVAATLVAKIEHLDRTLAARALEIAGNLDSRIQRIESAEETLAGSSQALDESLESRISGIGHAIDSRVAGMTRVIDSRISDITNVIGSRGDNVAATLVAKIEHIDRTLGTRALEVAGNLDSRIQRIEELNASVKTHTGNAERTLIDLSTNVSNTIKRNVEDAERVMRDVSTEVARNFTGKAAEISAAVSARAAEMTGVLDQGSSGLISALSQKSEEFANRVGRATDHALSEIESKGYAFTQSLAEQGAGITRGINDASVSATIAVTRTMQELQTASHAAIEKSKQTAKATVSEMLETHDMLRGDTTTLFERLREANILLQEVLSGAHENMSSLENTMVVRVSEFVASMNAVREQSGAATGKVDEQIGKFATVTTRVLGELSQLAVQFETHGRGLAEAVQLIDRSNRRTEEVLGERRVGLDSLVSTLDIRTEDLDQRLKRFTGLLDETLDAASGRAREIVSIVAEAGSGGAQVIAEQFNAMRTTAEEERARTAETMRGIYDEANNDTTAIFRQSTERFTEVMHGMKHMASEMQRELEATRAELRRGILELPQETAESAAQMRRVIVDQIEALAELNRIVARHGGRGIDVAEPVRRTATANHREDSMASSFERERTEAPRPAPRRDVPSPEAISREFGSRETSSSRELPSVNLSVSNKQNQPRRPSPAPAPAVGNGARPSGWLSDLLQRASRDEDSGVETPREAAPRETGRDERTAAHSIESLDSLSVDIARMIDHNAATELWDKYKRGERNVFTRRLYTLQGQKAFDDISKKYRDDREFRKTVDRYITEFERLLDEVSRDDRGQVVARTYLTSETGKVYTMLAHASGRFE